MPPTLLALLLRDPRRNAGRYPKPIGLACLHIDGVYHAAMYMDGAVRWARNILRPVTLGDLSIVEPVPAGEEFGAAVGAWVPAAVGDA
jgi:hypothetical protein